MSPRRARDKETGRELVASLTEAFAADLDYYKSADFDETTNRQRFIDPFFAALGWDVADEDKRGPYADVVLEYSLRRAAAGGQLALDQDEAGEQAVADAVASGEAVMALSQGRPDYSFRLNGERRFFVEAKRPSVEINSPGPIYQVKSYAWSARTPIALLTDFEQFLAFDCLQPPVLTEPMTGLLPEFRLTFGDYMEKWDLLWDTFSREAVVAGSLARYVKRQDRERLFAVDQSFLNDLTRWRGTLARAIAKENPDLDIWGLNDATQLTLDRLVFIRVCEDRRIEPTEVLRPLLEEDEPYPAFVEALVPLRENYNGGLLDPTSVDQLEVPARAFKHVVQGLYTPWSPYRFDVLGVDILGSIYERALGSTIEFGPRRQVSVTLKPEVRKAGGVYYTPQWVVDEIVRLTIDPLIQGKRPRDLQNFRVLDPACGSGSFLLGAFGRLIGHYEEYYSAHPTVDRRKHREDETGHRRLTEEAKAEILRRHIFGVDVDPAAVEVTMMSLYLKSLESDAPEFVRTQMTLSGAILPSLATNIQVGNSLVSTDFYAQPQLAQGLDSDEEHRLRPFKWDSREEGFGEILADGGFDAVIGNPPYFSIDGVYGAKHPVASYLKDAYPEVWLDKGDIYYFFLCKAVQLATRRLGFIVSRAFLEADRAHRLRSWLSDNARLEEVVDFDGYMVFADAGIATAVTSFDTSSGHGESEIKVRRLVGEPHSVEEVVEGLRSAGPPFEIFERDMALDGRPWRFPNPERKVIYDQLDEAGQELGALCELGQGMQTGANPVFGGLSAEDVEKHKLPAELLKPRARNSDIHRFWVAESGQHVLYVEDFQRFEDLPEPVQAFLKLPENQDRLKKRAAYKRGNCEWWKFTWPLHKEFYGRPHLINPYRTGHNRFAIDEDFTWLPLTDTTVAFPHPEVEEDIRYLCGLLNSRLLTFRFRGLAKLTGPGMWEAFDNSIKELPIRRINFSNAEEKDRHDEVVQCVRDLEQATPAEPGGGSEADRSIARRRTEGLLDRLDELVLDLYGITDENERATALSLGSPL